MVNTAVQEPSTKQTVPPHKTRNTHGIVQFHTARMIRSLLEIPDRRSHSKQSNRFSRRRGGGFVSGFRLADGTERALLDFLDLQTRRQRLLQLLGLLLVGDDQCVQETRAADLELGVLRVLLYLDGARVLSAGLDQEVLDLFDFLRHLQEDGNTISTLLSTHTRCPKNGGAHAKRGRNGTHIAFLEIFRGEKNVKSLPNLTFTTFQKKDLGRNMAARLPVRQAFDVCGVRFGVENRAALLRRIRVILHFKFTLLSNHCELDQSNNLCNYIKKNVNLEFCLLFLNYGKYTQNAPVFCTL